MEKKFLELVAEVMDMPVEELSLETGYEETDKWDSLMMMNIVMELEEEYEVSIPLEDLAKVKTLGDLYKMVEDE